MILNEKILTTKKYWIDYYQNANQEKDIIVKICGKYDWFWQKLIRSAKVKPKTILEIGAYPGRYLAYLSAKYHLKPTGLDFNPDKETVLNTFENFGITNGNYLIQDFLHVSPSETFDLVISNGFIEHFENYEDILDKHARFTKPGGAMLIMIPNKRHLRKWYGMLLDKTNLKAHNLKCMSLRTFNDFAVRNNLSIQFLDYYGGFAYRVHQKLSFLQRLVYLPVRHLSLLLNGYLSRHPSRFWSGTIIAILTKPL